MYTTLSVDQVVVIAGFGPARVSQPRRQMIAGTSVNGFDLELYCGTRGGYWVSSEHVSKKYQDGTFRDLTTPAVVTRALQILVKNRERQNRNANQRARKLHQRATSNDFVEMVTCLRDVYATNDKEYSTTYLNLFEKLLDQVAVEIALVYGIPRQGIRGQLESTIRNREITPELHQP